MEESKIIFCCPVCDIRLSVPVALAGVVGPCPSCRVSIRAPILPSPDPPGDELSEDPRGLTPIPPSAQEQYPKLIHQAPRQAHLDSSPQELPELPPVEEENQPDSPAAGDDPPAPLPPLELPPEPALVEDELPDLLAEKEEPPAILPPLELPPEPALVEDELPDLLAEKEEPPAVLPPLELPPEPALVEEELSDLLAEIEEPPAVLPPLELPPEPALVEDELSDLLTEKEEPPAILPPLELPPEPALVEEELSDLLAEIEEPPANLPPLELPPEPALVEEELPEPLADEAVQVEGLRQEEKLVVAREVEAEALGSLPGHADLLPSAKSDAPSSGLPPVDVAVLDSDAVLEPELLPQSKASDLLEAPSLPRDERPASAPEATPHGTVRAEAAEPVANAVSDGPIRRWFLQPWLAVLSLLLAGIAFMVVDGLGLLNRTPEWVRPDGQGIEPLKKPPVPEPPPLIETPPVVPELVETPPPVPPEPRVVMWVRPGLALPVEEQHLYQNAKPAELLQQFLKARTLRERWPMIATLREPRELKQTCLAGLLPEVALVELEFEDPRPDLGYTDTCFAVSFKGADSQMRQQAVWVRERKGQGPKVLADPFVDLHGGALAAFIAAPLKGERSFQLLVAAFTGCNDEQVPDPAGKMTLKLLASGNGEAIGRAYFSKSGPIARLLEGDDFQLSYGNPTACRLRLKWNDMESPGKPYLEALAIEHFGWEP